MMLRKKMIQDKVILESPEVIRTDFDRIASLSHDKWDHNIHYYPFLLNHIPHCQNALEIGCGTGTFSRLLAERADHVLALDLSPQMIRLAQERSARFSNISFQIADFLEYPLFAESFDCVVTIATLHHMPLEESLLKMRHALRIGGQLVVLDLCAGEGLYDLLNSAIAFPVSLLLRLIRNGRLRESKTTREAWAEHARHDHLLPISYIRSVCASVLPGAQVRKHLFWRYSIIWTKTVA